MQRYWSSLRYLALGTLCLLAADLRRRPTPAHPYPVVSTGTVGIPLPALLSSTSGKRWTTLGRCLLSVHVLCGSPVGPSPSVVGPLRGPPFCVGPLRGPSGWGSSFGVLPSGIWPTRLARASFACREPTTTGLSLYKILFHFEPSLWESIIRVCPPHLQRLPYCNTNARPLRNIRPPPPPLCMPYTIQYWWWQYRVKATTGRSRAFTLVMERAEGAQLDGRWSKCLR